MEVFATRISMFILILTSQNKDTIDLRKRLTSELISLQQHTSVEPYSVVHRLKLAKAYKSLGYPDLAVGDAYKALLLIDEVAEEGEYHEEALAAAEADFLSDRMASLDVDQNAEKILTKEHDIVTWTEAKSSKNAYVSLSISRFYSMVLS